MASIIRKIYILAKENKYGTIDEVHFITEYRKGHPEIVTGRYIKEYEDWKDGHKTSGKYQNLMFPGGIEYGNNRYKRLISDGYTLKDKYEIEPTDPRLYN